MCKISHSTYFHPIFRHDHQTSDVDIKMQAIEALQTRLYDHNVAGFSDESPTIWCDLTKTRIIRNSATESNGIYTQAEFCFRERNIYQLVGCRHTPIQTKRSDPVIFFIVYKPFQII